MVIARRPALTAGGTAADVFLPSVGNGNACKEMKGVRVGLGERGVEMLLISKTRGSYAVISKRKHVFVQYMFDSTHAPARTSARPTARPPVRPHAPATR